MTSTQESGSTPGPRIPTTFAAMKLADNMLDRLIDLEILRPSPVQAYCIPQILAGKTVFAEAPTGSGKTMAYVIPTIEKLMEDPFGIFGLVVVPTRELVHQVADQFRALGGNKLKVVCLMGRMDMQEQTTQLYNKPHIVITTPGRFKDIQEQDKPAFNKLFQNLQIAVIDELDAFDRTMREEECIEDLWAAFPRAKQHLFFSATLSESNSKDYLVKKYDLKTCFNYRDKQLEANFVVSPYLKQKYVLCPPDFKDGYLVQLLRIIREEKFETPINSIMVFVRTKTECETLSMTLTALKYNHVALHSDMCQKLRFASLNEFKSSIKNTLIATDLASRGLDIKTVDLVINYSVPWGVDYVHRVGRTGRGGRTGYAITLITPRDIPFLQKVETFVKTKLEEYKINEKNVLEILAEVRATKKAAEVMLTETESGDQPSKKKMKLAK